MENNHQFPPVMSANGVDVSAYFPYNHNRRRASLEITVEEEEEEETSFYENSRPTLSNRPNQGGYNGTLITPEAVCKSLHNKKTGGSIYSGVSTARAKIQRSHQHVHHLERIVEVPKDGNLSSFSCKELCSVLSCMKFNPSVIARIKNHRINGRTFGKLTDDELRDLGINNPIVQHFRNKSKRKNCIFML